MSLLHKADWTLQHACQETKGMQAQSGRNCAHCQETFVVSGSGLRKHACLASGLLPFNTRLSADCTRFVDATLQQLRKLGKNHLKQLECADSDPLNVAVAAIWYCLNPALTQS